MTLNAASHRRVSHQREAIKSMNLCKLLVKLEMTYIVIIKSCLHQLVSSAASKCDPRVSAKGQDFIFTACSNQAESAVHGSFIMSYKIDLTSVNYYICISAQ